MANCNVDTATPCAICDEVGELGGEPKGWLARCVDAGACNMRWVADVDDSIGMTVAQMQGCRIVGEDRRALANLYTVSGFVGAERWYHDVFPYKGGFAHGALDANPFLPIPDCSMVFGESDTLGGALAGAKAWFAEERMMLESDRARVSTDG